MELKKVFQATAKRLEDIKETGEGKYYKKITAVSIPASERSNFEVQSKPAKKPEKGASNKKLFEAKPREFNDARELEKILRTDLLTDQKQSDASKGRSQTINSLDSNLGKRIMNDPEIMNIILPVANRKKEYLLGQIPSFKPILQLPKAAINKKEEIDSDSDSDENRQPNNQITRTSRSSKGYIIYAEDRITEKVPKLQEHIDNVDHIFNVLKHFYTCRPWKERPIESIKAVGKIPWFLNFIGTAIFDARELTPDNYETILENNQPKTKRKDELQKKVLSKARWEATRTNIITPRGVEMELRVMARDYALLHCKGKEQRVTAIRSIRRIFGNIEKTCTYAEADIEIQRLINDKQGITDAKRQELMEERHKLFSRISEDACDLPKEIKNKLESSASSSDMKDLVAKAIHNMGSLVKEGLHNEAARAMITNKVIVDNMLTSYFLNKVLSSLDEQTVNDIQTNYISKLKAAYYDLENGVSLDKVETYLKSCFNTTKFSKHPLTHIQNAQAMVDYLHKLNYRAKSEKSDHCPPPREHLRSLKVFFEKEYNKRYSIKEGKELEETKPSPK